MYTYSMLEYNLNPGFLSSIRRIREKRVNECKGNRNELYERTVFASQLRRSRVGVVHRKGFFELLDLQKAGLKSNVAFIYRFTWSRKNL